MDKMAARLAAMLEEAKSRNLIERMDVITPRPFDRATTATIPQVGLLEASCNTPGCHVPPRFCYPDDEVECSHGAALLSAAACPQPERSRNHATLGV